MELRMNSETNTHTHAPRHSALSEGLLHVHVGALEVDNDDAEVVVLSLTVQLLHVCDELLHPASLVLH